MTCYKMKMIRWILLEANNRLMGGYTVNTNYKRAIVRMRLILLLKVKLGIVSICGVPVKKKEISMGVTYTVRSVLSVGSRFCVCLFSHVCRFSLSVASSCMVFTFDFDTCLPNTGWHRYETNDTVLQMYH